MSGPPGHERACDTDAASAGLVAGALDHAPMPVTLHDLDGRLHHVNRAAAELIGHAPETLLDGARHGLLEVPALGAVGDETTSTELSSTHPDGSRRDYLVTRYPIRDQAGQVVGIGSISLDITERKRTEDKFRGLIEAQAEAIVISDLDGKIVLVNAQTERLFGYAREELVGQHVEMLIPVHHRERHEHLRGSYCGDTRTRAMGAGLELYAQRKDGHVFPIDVSISRLGTNDGTLVTSTICDITARKQAEASLQEAEERFRLAFEFTPIGMALVALDGEFLRVNRALCEITGYSDHELLRRSVRDITQPDDVELAFEGVTELLVGTVRSYRTEARHVNALGHIVWARLSVSLVRDASGKPLHFIAQVEDISERKRMEDRLRRLADYDALTGIRNRRQFERDLAAQIATCQRYGEQAALLMVDLDEFKQVNDTHGHHVGDEVLKAVAGAIRKRLRVTDTVARLGGDEFAVLLPHVSSEKAVSVADDLKRCIAGVTIRVPGASVNPSASVGVAYINEHAVSNEAILHEADRAMYAMKRAGGHLSAVRDHGGSSTLPKAG